MTWESASKKGMRGKFLTGRTVGVTSSRRANELALLIKSFGGVPWICPLVGIEVSNRPGELADQVFEFTRGGAEPLDYVVFLSGPSAFAFLKDIEASSAKKQILQSLLERSKILARSQKVASVIRKFGLTDSIEIPHMEKSMNGILAHFSSAKNAITGKNVLIVWHGEREPYFSDTLEQKIGARVFEISPYRYAMSSNAKGTELLRSLRFNESQNPDQVEVSRFIQYLVSGAIDTLTFTSPPAVSNLIDAAEEFGGTSDLLTTLNKNVTVAAIGPSTERALEEFGVMVDVVPEPSKLGPLVVALNEFAGSNDGPKRLRAEAQRKNSHSVVQEKLTLFESS